MLARLLALLLALMPVPAVAQEMTRAQAAPYLGMYLFKDGSFAELSWLEDIPAPLLTDYPDGIIRALRPDGPGRFTGDDSDDPLFRTKGFWIVDARAAWDIRRLTVFAYAQNLFNTFEVIGWAGPRDDPDLEVGLTDPREIGVGVEARF
jgi:outer membrane receptor protein involved in Fe transport